MSNYQRFVLSSSESQEHNLVRHPGSQSTERTTERTTEVPRGRPPSPSSARWGTMCDIDTNLKYLHWFFPLQESSQSWPCRRAAWLYANSIVLWRFKPGYRRPSSNKAEGVSTAIINLRRHLYSPHSRIARLAQPGINSLLAASQLIDVRLVFILQWSHVS